MRHAMVTIAAPIIVERIDATVLQIEKLGNPANPAVSERLDRQTGEAGIHFLSLHAFHPADLPRTQGHIVLEFSADGTDDEALERVVIAVGSELEAVFSKAKDWQPGSKILDYLKKHQLHCGYGWTLLAGLPFSGTPGLSVGRIRKEAELADRLRSLILSQTESRISALQRLSAIRETVSKDAKLSWALETPEPMPPVPKATTSQTIVPLAFDFVRTYLWILALPAFAVLVTGLVTGWSALWAVLNTPVSLFEKSWLLLTAAWSAIRWIFGALMAFAVPLLLIALGLYLSLRKKEATDWTSDLAPERSVLNKILSNENRCAQNHMVSLTVIKPGLTRKVTLRLAFWIIAGLTRLKFKPGFLSEIDTIHFARWVQLPGTRNLLFFSNYGGSWESYLEDFITRAHDGLTAVWSNTVGFPRSENLFKLGATDGERFKRYARHSMVPTPFWYSAYPQLSTLNIRTNVVLRCGLAAAMTEEEAALWLSQFGSAERPAAKLETTEIQSLVFGGLGFKPHGVMVLMDFGASEKAPEQTDNDKARAWLKAIVDSVAFGDGRRLQHKAVITLALAPRGLAGLGLPEQALETFPAAFIDGMTGPGRLRLLGDNANDWQWSTTNSYDVALLIYGETAASVAGLQRKLTAQAKANNHSIIKTIPLDEIPKDRRERKEPFGFIDGTSQPTIRGTYRGLRNGDPLHLVEAGEFILGYPDNRGNIPPGPVMSAVDDPNNILPVVSPITAGFDTNTVDAPRDPARNGSFLVIRQLEQHVEAFQNYCTEQALRLQGRLVGPFNVDADFIGAKMIGRWPDGSSLARNPYAAFSRSNALEQKVTRRVTSNPSAGTYISSSAATQPNQLVQEVVRSAAASKIITASQSEEYRKAAFAEDNDFLFGAEDPEGLRCPFGAHIRRANPRDSLDPGSLEQIAISNRHRIMRVGRSYGKSSGLMFMCLNGDIERQFEFVQHTWLRSETFHGLSHERDPLSLNKGDAPSGFTIPSRDGPAGLAPLPNFVTPRGGGYFFLPSRRLLNYLLHLKSTSHDG